MAIVVVKRSALTILALLSLAVAGCDKCGNRVKLNSPEVQHVCGDNAEPLR